MQPVNQSEGPPSIRSICNDACCRLVLLYAKLGLHRYNLLRGKNLQLSSVSVYNTLKGPRTRIYDINSEAMDPATDLPLLFKTRVREQVNGGFVLNCNIARPLVDLTDRSHVVGRDFSYYDSCFKMFFTGPVPVRRDLSGGETKIDYSDQMDFKDVTKKSDLVGGGQETKRSDQVALTRCIRRHKGRGEAKSIYHIRMEPKRRRARYEIMPEWPPENPFEKFKLVNESELQDNDWIRLYLELAVATTNRTTEKNHDLSSLKIVQVAIDTTKNVMYDDLEGLTGRNAIVYIRYTDSCEARVGMDVDRVAIVRRAIDERRDGFGFYLTGQNMISPVGMDVDLGRGCLSSALDQIHLTM